MKGMGCDRFPLGEILHDEFLKPLGLTVKEVSRRTAIREHFSKHRRNSK
jgi:plasmid maintenance system antidote protein VapI